MAAATPKRKVKWDIDDDSFPSFGSPYAEGSSVLSTSSLEYINSQLVAHGFVSSPGLVFDGISDSSLAHAVKCLLGMLSQRMEDMSRTEELSTKLRILSYDHERLLSMHRAAKETAAHAEREMNLHKSRFSTATRTLQATETAHKQTTAELQRTRTMVQGIRTAHQTEIKKREKDVERMADKWSKLADAQTKLMTVPSGIRCANAQIVTGSEFLGKGQGFLEIALEEAEKARVQFMDENLMLRKLVVKTINRVTALVREAHPTLGDQELTPHTLATLFPLHPMTHPSDQWNLVLDELEESLALPPQPRGDAITTAEPSGPSPDEEIARLQGVINTLKEELEQSRYHAVKQAAETQAMFDKYLLTQDKVNTNNIGEPSVDLMTSPFRDEEKERLENIEKELEQERQKYTEAAIKLGKDRAEIEVERIKLLDEKRSWQVKKMLAEFPPTPQPDSPLKQVTTILLSPKKSPRKSPAKVRVGKGSGGSSKRKTTRVPRRSLTSPSKAVPAYETEVIPPIPAPILNTDPLPSVTSLLPTSFVLPPPSPRTSLPTEPALPLLPLPAIDFRVEPASPEPPSQPSNPPIPSTPSLPRASFPVAKPFAQRMIHAYSPAKPSPLSRILMLGNSPSSPDPIGSDDSSLLQPVMEEPEDVTGFGDPVPLSVPLAQEMSLAEELGIPVSPPERGKKKAAPTKASGPPARRVVAPTTTSTAKGKSSQPPPKDKGKAKALPSTSTTTTQARSRTTAGIEKENSRKPAAPPTKVFAVGSALRSPTKATTTSRARLTAKLPPPGKDGPRRVLIDSAEAAPRARARRG